MKVAILDDYQDQVRSLTSFDALQEHQVTVFNDTVTDIEELVARLLPFEVLILIRERTEIDQALLARLPNLKLISQTGKISNHLNLDHCTQHNVAVAEGVGSPIAPSELAWALIMAATRHLPSYIANLQQGKWQHSDLPGLGTCLHGKTLGIWGYGKIGQRLAKFADVFGMKVMIWGSEASRTKAIQDGYKAAQDKAHFFSHCDVISLNLRLNDATRHLVTFDDLNKMKQGSLLVNISRAELIEPHALYRSLCDNPNKLAAVDVFEQEPAHSENQPLLNLPNVIATPHLGYVEQNSYELYFKWAINNVISFAKGSPENIANPQVLC